MATCNNYDCSSTGLNLDLTFMLDDDLARIWFEDTMVRIPDCLRPEGYYGDTYFYLRNETSSDIVDADWVEFWFNLDKVDLEALLKAEVDGVPVRAIVDDYELDLDALTIINELRCSHISSADELVEFVSKLAPLKFGCHQTRGYSQRDAATVLYQVLEDDTDEGFDLEVVIDRLFWDQPAYIRLTINDEEEIDLVEQFLEDEYSYDKGRLISAIKASMTFTDQVVEFLEDNLPEYL